MKKGLITICLIAACVTGMKGQEKYGKTLNIGLGLGYYGLGASPAIHLNYEFDVFKNFTLAPFVTFQTRRTYYKGYDQVKGYNRNYYYRETYIPIGAKGTYYFDEIFEAGDKWDFYAAASLGFAIRSTKWEDPYYNTGVITSPSPIYGSLHIGTELHLSPKAGLFLDVSTGLSTFGLAIHM